MTRAALVKLLIAQTVLLVLALWAGAWLGRDEFLLATEGPEEEEIETSASPVADAGAGVPAVRLTRKAQRVVGIEVAAAEETELAETRRLPATVLDVQPLAELRGRLQAARHEADAALAAATASSAEHKRVQGLYDDDRNASQRALEAATAQAAADAARARAAQAALATLRDGARARWGARVAAWLDAPTGGPLERLVAGRDALLRVALPPEIALPADAALALPRDGGEPLRAAPLGAAPALDAAGPGRLYLVAGAGLAPGQRVELDHSGAIKEVGALVPPTAIVWHAGQAWVYVRESGRDEDDDDDPPKAAAPAASAAAAKDDDAEPAGDAFERRAAPRARRVGERWFLPAFFEDDPVVVQGAQVLLSEELKYQIRDENDD
jgi:multidrug efflux system membrane fusion protein